MVIAVSGNLGLHVINSLNFKIQGILTDSNSTEIIKYCETSNIPFFKGNPRNKNVVHFFEKNSISNSLLFSINYIFLFDHWCLNYFKTKLNIHGSLLPKYRGRTPHVWAVINGESEYGFTIHSIEEGCDSGEIVYQESIPIESHETGNDLLLKFKFFYPLAIKETIGRYYKNNLTFSKQNETNATYFPKRSPSDGEFNLKWEYSRIHNWVRAQSFPYPGAFIYLEDKKIIIDKVILIKKSDINKELIGVINPDSLIVQCKDAIIQLIKRE